jgi:hypothetical protein
MVIAAKNKTFFSNGSNFTLFYKKGSERQRALSEKHLKT